MPPIPVVCSTTVQSLWNVECRTEQDCVPIAKRRLTPVCGSLGIDVACEMRGPPTAGGRGVPSYCVFGLLMDRRDCNAGQSCIFPASTRPFDVRAAAEAIGRVNVQTCFRDHGPTGAGHVWITFSPDGTASSAVVDAGTFPGTATGGCIAGKYRGVRVPSFAGPPVRVEESFTIDVPGRNTAH